MPEWWTKGRAAIRAWRRSAWAAIQSRFPPVRGRGLLGWLVVAISVGKAVWEVVNFLSNADFVRAHLGEMYTTLMFIWGGLLTAWNWPGTPLLGLVVGFAVLLLTPRPPAPAPVPLPEPIPLPPLPQGPPELVHDNVLWRDGGGSYVGHGGTMAEGPFCPFHRTTLRYTDIPQDGLRAPNQDVGRDLRWIGGGYGALVCVECWQRFFLTDDGQPKDVRASREEVEARFDGLRRNRRDF